MATRIYKLKDRKPVLVATSDEDTQKYSKAMQCYIGFRPAYLIARDEVGDYEVVSAFTALDATDNNPPLLFETAVYEGRVVIFCYRTPSWKEAREMHTHVLNLTLISGEQREMPLEDALGILRGVADYARDTLGGLS